MTTYEMDCKCCHLTVEIRKGGASRRQAVIRYNGREFIGWAKLADHMRMSEGTALSRAKRGCCLQECIPRGPRCAVGRRGAPGGAGIGELLRAWR